MGEELREFCLQARRATGARLAQFLAHKYTLLSKLSFCMFQN